MGVMFFQLLAHLISTASTVAPEQVASTVAYSHHVLQGRGKQPKAKS